jgi:hypothetical protein
MSFSIPIPYSSFEKISSYGLDTITLTGTGVSFDNGTTVNSSYGVTPTVPDTGQLAYNQANTAFAQANSGITFTQQVYDFANTIGGGSAIDNVARTSAQTAFTLANNTNISLSQQLSTNVALFQSVNDAQNTYTSGAYSLANASVQRVNANTSYAVPTSGTISIVGINGLSVTGVSNVIHIIPPQDLRTTAVTQFGSMTLSSPLPITSGGTGTTSAAAALTTLLPTGTTSGYVLTTGGPGSFYWSAPTGGGGGGVTPGTSINTTRSFPTVNVGQTLFYTPTYVPGASQLRAYVDGVRQFNSAYTETSNNTITFATGLSGTESVMFEVDGYYVNPYYANNITFTAPVGGISATANTIQLAIQDVEVRKATLDSPQFIGIPTAPTQPQTTSNTTIATTAYVQSAVAALLPSGTSILFQQSTAPTGWTKQTTHNDKALRVVSGSVSSGGSVAFSTAFASQAVSGSVGSTTLSESQIPSHVHVYGGDDMIASQGGFTVVSGFSYDATSTSSGGGVRMNTYSTGGSGSHNHSFSGTAINLAVNYVDVIIATKD